MLFAGCRTDNQTPKALNFVQSNALVEDIEQLITSGVRHIVASVITEHLICDFSQAEAVFIEVDTPDNIYDSLELVKHIRLTNQVACIFILVTHSKSFTSINYYLAGADHCIKLPAAPLEKTALLSRTIADYRGLTLANNHSADT